MRKSYLKIIKKIFLLNKFFTPIMDKLPNSKYFNAKPFFTAEKRYYNSLQIDKPRETNKTQIKSKESSFKKSQLDDKVTKFLIENRDVLDEASAVQINEVYQVGKVKGSEKKYY